jgi:uncharacterized protein YbaP (TraB family)
MAMFSGFARRLAAFGLAAGLLAACQTPAPAVPPAAANPPGPAMWVIKDADSTIYLFGTVHVLKPDTQWRNPRIDAALAAASELWLEVPMTDPEAMQAEMLPLVMQHGMAMDKPLNTRLTPEEYATLGEAVEAAGAPIQAVNLMRPWLASLTIQVAGIQRAGYDPNAGVENQLVDIFKQRNINSRGLETLAFQIGVFTGLPEAAELDLLRQTLKEYKEAPTQLDRLVSLWAAGDTAALEAEVVAPMKADDAMYQALLVRRNANWTVKIEEMLRGSGTVFIAVGAGHLIGPDSVQAQLARRGITATRS